jgi:hypothetical protein
MTDFTLSDGTEITFDLDKLTYGQWKGLFDPRESDEESDQTVARVAGLEYAELKRLPFMDYKGLFNALLKRCREPLASPN